MKAYKGFDKDMKCRGFQYEVGKTYEEPEAVLCEKGFHACAYPLDVFTYYSPAESRFAVVEIDDLSDNRSYDSKICGKKIKIEKEIDIAKIVEDSVNFINEKTSNTELSTGDCSAATNTGNRSAATNTGDYSAATNTGEGGVASSLGIGGKSKGALGCWLVLAEWEKIDYKWHRIDVQCRRVDGEAIKADTFYRLKNGEFVEAADDE